MTGVVGTDLQPATPSTGDPAVQPGAEEADTGGARSPFPWAGGAAVLLGLLVVAPILWAGVNGLARTWYPAGDWAMTELRTLDVGTSHTPLVGVYSRYSWNHPGPLLFWILAVPYRVFGRNPSALLLGAALINATAVAGMLWLAWRRARLALVAPLAFTLALLVHALGPLLIRNPWNAWIVVLPFGLLVVATWSALEGDRLGWPFVAATGAFLGQTHVGLAPFVVVATLVAVAAVVRRRSWRALVPGTIVLVACWAPVLVDLVAGSHNLVAILDHFRRGSATAGWSTGFGIATRELTAPAPWLGGVEEVNPAGGGLRLGDAALLTVPVALFLAALGAAALARAWRAVRLQIVVAGTAAVGVFAVSRITDDVFDYLVRWWWTIAALATASILFSVVDATRAVVATLTATPSSRIRLAAQGGVVAVAAVLVIRAMTPTAQEIGNGALPVDDWFPSMNAVAAPVLASLDHGRPVLVRAAGPLCGWVSDAIEPRLAADGYDVRVDDVGISRYKLGAFRMAPTDPAEQARMQGLWVVTGFRIHDFRTAGTGREVARFDPLTPDERVEYDTLEHELRAVYASAGRDDLAHNLDDGVSLFSDRPVPDLDPVHQARYEELRRRGVAVSVFVTTADQRAPDAHLP